MGQQAVHGAARRRRQGLGRRRMQAAPRDRCLPAPAPLTPPHPSPQLLPPHPRSLPPPLPAAEQKLFMGREFVLKHIRNKHSVAVDARRERLQEEVFWENFRCGRAGRRVLRVR